MESSEAVCKSSCLPYIIIQVIIIITYKNKIYIRRYSVLVIHTNIPVCHKVSSDIITFLYNDSLNYIQQKLLVFNTKEKWYKYVNENNIVKNVGACMILLNLRINDSP